MVREGSRLTGQGWEDGWHERVEVEEWKEEAVVAQERIG